MPMIIPFHVKSPNIFRVDCYYKYYSKFFLDRNKLSEDCSGGAYHDFFPGRCYDGFLYENHVGEYEHV